MNRNRNKIRVETTIHNKSGKVIHVQVTSAALFDEEDNFMGGVEAFQDITAMKALEREKANLISMLAHDMRSSLTGIHGLGLRLLNKLEDR